MQVKPEVKPDVTFERLFDTYQRALQLHRQRKVKYVLEYLEDEIVVKRVPVTVLTRSTS